MSKPLVLVDMDGPLADFDRHFWAECKVRGFSFDCEPHEQTHRFATAHMTSPVERAAARSMVDHDPSWFESLPVVDGAVDGINRLAEQAEVWLCTKPLEANPWCRDSKAAWVRHNLGRDWERRLILAPDKSLVAGDILLDDAPHRHWFQRALWKPVMFPTPFNGAGSEWERLPRWDWSMDVRDLLVHADWTVDLYRVDL